MGSEAHILQGYFIIFLIFTFGLVWSVSFFICTH